MLKLVEEDKLLKPFAGIIEKRHQQVLAMEREFTYRTTRLSDSCNSYLYYGLQMCIRDRASLAVLEQKVLLVDADPQGNATTGVGYDLKELKATIYECLVDGLEPKEDVYKRQRQYLPWGVVFVSCGMSDP